MNPNDDPGRPIVRSKDVNVRLIAFAVVVILAVVFVAQNRSRVKLHFLFFDPYWRVWVAMAVSFVLGVLADRLFGAWWRRRNRSES